MYIIMLYQHSHFFLHVFVAFCFKSNSTSAQVFAWGWAGAADNLANGRRCFEKKTSSLSYAIGWKYVAGLKEASGILRNSHLLYVSKWERLHSPLRVNYVCCYPVVILTHFNPGKRQMRISLHHKKNNFMPVFDRRISTHNKLYKYVLEIIQKYAYSIPVYSNILYRWPISWYVSFS